MKNYLLIFFLLGGLFSNAQIWNPLNYNKHHHGLENNPLKGFASMWDVDSQFPYSIQGNLFKFNDIVIGNGVYDWSSVDNFIEAEALKGKHVYLQVNIDPVKNAQLDLPQYIMDALALPNPTTGLDELV